MPETPLTAELFELSIALERAAESFYRALAQMFAHEPEVFRFWKNYADEEAGHARFLEDLRRKLSEAQLSRPVELSMLETARQQLRYLSGKSLEDLHNLEEAYQAAVEIENSETKTIFEFLGTDFALTRRSGKFLREQLHNHVKKLTAAFPASFRGQLQRLEVLAASPR